ncbi:MAG: hypothetical protein ABI887_10275 [Burkholderiales bacterium]
MNQEQLMDRLSRLKRKLSMSHEAWHSGRIDCLVDALRHVERELHAWQTGAAPAKETVGLIRLH